MSADQKSEVRKCGWPFLRPCYIHTAVQSGARRPAGICLVSVMLVCGGLNSKQHRPTFRRLPCLLAQTGRLA